MGKAVDIGYKKTLELYDEALAESLKANILEFSAFKEASYRVALVELIEEKNILPTWKEFKEEALKLSKNYNVNWLKTEYDQTVATANMAGKYNDFLETADLYPNLQYVTVGDRRVRDKHKKWDGFIAPIKHPIWQKLLPPNDWGCRCDVLPSDDEPTAGYKNFDADIKEEFANNPAISGKVFENSTYEKMLSRQKLKEAKYNINGYRRLK